LTASRAPDAAAPAPSAGTEAVSSLPQEIRVPPREDALAPSKTPRRGRALRYISVGTLLLVLLGGAGLAAVDSRQLMDVGLPPNVAKLAAVPGEKVRGLLQVAVGAATAGKSDAKPTSRDGAGAQDGAVAKAESPAIEPEPRREASADLAEKMEQLRQTTEHEGQALAAKLDRMAERLESLERQLAAAAAAPAVQPAAKPVVRPVALPAQPPGAEAKPAPKPAAGDAKPAPKPSTGEAAPGAGKTVANWKVREVMDGIAILEGPPGFIRVSRGDRVPGVGWVQSMQRQGNGWTVTTSNGVITPK
jgi:hypothetical protein